MCLIQFLKKNIINLILLSVTTVSFFLLRRGKYIADFSSFSSSEHFSILNLASLFGGFVFTGLGIMLSGLSSPRIERLNDYGYMDKYYSTIYLALVCNITTIFAAVVLISSKKLIPVVATIEQLMLYLSIVFFVKCMLDVKRIISKIRKK